MEAPSLSALPLLSVSSAPFHTISPELWYSIIAHFDPDENREDLVSCSLACREFVDPSQRVLFTKLTLDSDSEHTLTPILQKLTASPRFALYIRHICVHDLRSGQTWYGTDDLRKLLDLCTAVVKLSIFDNPHAVSPPGTTLGTRNTRICETALLFRSLSSSVHTIDITEQKYPYNIESAVPEFLNGFPLLKTLVISELRGDEKVPSASYTGSPPEFELTSLVLGACKDIRFLKWLTPALRGLTHLTIEPGTAFGANWNDGEDSLDEGRFLTVVRDAFQRWLKYIGDRVTHLTLQWTFSDSFGLDEFILLTGCTPRVEYLTISGADVHSFDAPFSFYEVCYLPLLKEWILELYFHTASGIDPEYYNRDIVCWKYWQGTLGRELRNARFTLSFEFILDHDATELPQQYRGMYEGIEERFTAIFNRFSSRNLLHITRCIRKGIYRGMKKD